jgi:hypothetical protein
VLATTTLPWPAPNPTRFASIHSNPPWKPTTQPEVVLQPFGEGAAIYCASLIENMESLSARALVNLLRRLDPCDLLEMGAPGVVEATVFDQPERQRLVLSLVNFQKDLPNIPIVEIPVQVRPPRGTVSRAVMLPKGVELRHETLGGAARFVVPRLETLAMIALELDN